ncbi:MAG: hypothetical protein QGG71_02215 [Pirellulaceae bacterium]|nr:hypothetical protein [Pirellulaceae bacterium]
MMARRHQIWCHAAIGFWLLGGGSVAAQMGEDEPAGGSPSVYVVREYLPKEKVPSRLKGYMAIRRDEFEDKLEAMMRTATDDVAGEAQLVSGVFYAKYRDGQLVDGRAGLEVVNKHQADSVLSLAPCRLPIRQLRWSDLDAPNVTAGAGIGGNYVVFADRSSRLIFAWSLRGNGSSTVPDSPAPLKNVGTEFFISLPPSSINQLVLDLPKGLVPVVDVGDTRLLDNGFEDLAVVPETVDAGSDRWLVALGGTHEFKLQVLDRVAATASNASARLRQATTYRLSTSAIEVHAEISLAFLQVELHRLVLETAPDLRVASVRIGQHELLPDQITRGEKAEQVVLTFDTPLQGSGRTLIVDALSPLVMNKPMRLPTLRPLDLDWEQATAVLEVPDTLILKKFVCTGAVETSVESPSGMAGGEVHHLQLYNQDATCEVVVGRPSTQTVVTSGSAIAVSPTKMTANIVADVHSVEGDVYLLDARINAPWKVDSVESTPTDALEGTPARRTRGRRIRIQLRQPVSGDEKVRILINARRGMPTAGTDLTAEDFQIIDFGNVAAHRRLVSLRAEAPYHLMVAGKPQTNVDPVEFSETDRELLGPLTSGLVYVDEGQDDSFRVSLTQEKPRYTGRISVEAMADSDVLRQAIRIRCQPESSPVSSLLVRLSPLPDVPFTWSTDEPDGVLSARLIKTADSQETAAWEVHLRQPRTTPFHVTAVCSSPLIDTTPVYLATLVEAVDQTGTVAVGAVDGTTLSVDVSDLTAVPIVKPREDEYTYQRAAYRYDPTRDHAVTVSRQSGPREPVLAWAWACELVSRFETNGVTSHRVWFKIQNSGRPQTEITLPATATVHRVSVDETEVSYAKSSDGTPRITIQLPPKKRFPSVFVDYSTHGEPLRGFTSRKTGWPQIDMSCLDRTWDIWLPPGMYAREDARFVKNVVKFSPNWEDRLFGAANLRSKKRPFDLFSLSDWRTIGQTPSRDAAMAAANFVPALTKVVAANDATDTSNETLTWGQVVSRYERLRSTARSPDRLRSLRIDTNALRDENVTADTLVSTKSRQSVSKVLAEHNLAVVASPDSILLTSAIRLGDFDDGLSPTRDLNVFVTQRDGSSFAAGPEGAVSSHVWSNETAIGPEPWSHVGQEDAQEFGLGWRHYQLRPGQLGSDTASVVQFEVYRPAVLRVMGWGISFVMIAAVIWFSTRRVKSLILIVLATILTLLVPIQFVPLARGMMWGSLAGLFLTFLRDKAINTPPQAELPRVAVTLARMTVILLVALGAWQVFADDDAKNSAPNAIQIYRVLFPVDEKQEPVGEYVHVPDALFNSLHRPAAAKSASLTWLLRSAAYETSLALRSDAEGLVEAEVSADYELETFQMGTTVALPLERDGVRSLTSVKLDGQIIDPAWNAAGMALELPVTRPGRYRLELTIVPVLRNDTESESSGFDLRVPEFAGARLKVSPSMRIEGIELPSASGAIDQSESLGTIAADMGPTNLLAVRWPLSSKTSEEPIPLTAVERFWLRIQPSSVVLEGQFEFTVPRGGIEQVRLLVDPRLKLSQLIPSQPANHEPESGPIPSIVVRFDEPGENQVSVYATFLMTDTSGLGNVYLPRLSAVADDKGSATFGLSVAPELEVELVADPPLQAILPAEFLADWNEPTDAPQLAYRLDEPTRRWHMTSRPRAVPPVTQQLSSWSIGWTRAGLHYSADVELGGRNCFRQRLRVPQSIEIRNLEVFRGEELQAVRWTRANSVLTVFFERAIEDRYRLVIDGEAPTAFRARTTLPLVSMQGVEFQSNRMVVRQRPDVLIQNLKAKGLVDEADELTDDILADHENGRIVNSFLVPSVTEDETETSLSFLTRRNRPQISGRIVNRVSFGEDDVWFADTEITLDLKSGVVDELRMALPVGWSQPLTLTPEINHEIVGMDADRVLVLRPHNSTRDRFRLHIRCESQRATAALSEVPLVKILNESQVQQYLVLPSRRGEEVISWATNGLQPIPNLSNQNSPLQDVDSTSYRVEDTRVTAVVHNVGRLGATSQVQLADFNVAWNYDRTCYGVAAFDVTPLQIAECILVVPPGLSIAHVKVAGVPVTLRSEKENRVGIPLGPEQLPQRIEVVFFGQLSSTSAIPGEMIAAPSLANLPVEQTLWTIHGPVGAHLDKALLKHSLTDAVQQAQIRASSATHVLEMAEMLTPPAPEVGFESWRQTWQRRRDLATSIVDGTRDPAVDAEIEISDLAARNFQEAGNGRGQPVRFAMHGVSSSVNIQFSHDEASDLGQRAGISVAIAGLGLLFGFVRRKFRLREWIEQSWHALGVSFGIVWWLWFTPSFVGLVVMGLSLVAALWPVRKSRRVPRAGA